jgi:hypothetical protein
MAIMQRTALGQVVRRRAWNVGVRFPSAFLARSVSTVGRLIVGSGGEYRNYPRERFSDYELHQIVAGRKDRFDGLR